MLDLDAFERCNKAEGLGMGDGSSSQTKNLQDVDTTCKIFRLLQLLCEGHNLGKVYSGLVCMFMFKKIRELVARKFIISIPHLEQLASSPAYENTFDLWFDPLCCGVLYY